MIHSLKHLERESVQFHMSSVLATSCRSGNLVLEARAMVITPFPQLTGHHGTKEAALAHSLLFA